MKNALPTSWHFGKLILILSAFFVFPLLSFNAARAQCPLSAPTLFPPKAVTCNSFTLSFGSVSGAAAYQVEYSTNASFSPSSTLFVTPSNPVITGLNPGTEYYYRVRSFSNTCGYSSPSISSQFVTNGPPTSFGVINLTCTAARINYHTYPSGITGHTITDMSGSIAPIYKSGGGAFLFEDLTGLTPNTTYTFTITAYTSTTPACTLTSAPIVFTTPLPATPSVISASLVTCTGFRANWVMIAGVDGYTIDISDDPSFSNLLYNNQYIAGDVNNFFDISFLNSSTNYYYRVRAEQNGCTSLSSATQAVLTDDVVANSIVTSSNITCTTADVNWTSSPGASSYDLIVKEQNTGIIVATSNAPGTLSLFGLQPGITYEYIASVYKMPDCSAYTIGTFTTDPLPDAPLPPSSFVQQSCSTANISWNSVPGVNEYQLQVASDPGFSSLIYSATSTTPYQDVAGLFPNVPYFYRIASIIHQSCVGPYSSVYNMMLLPPLPPSGINVQNVSCFAAELNWTPHTGTDLVQVSEDPSFSSFILNQPIGGGILNLINIKPGTTYYYRVASMESPSCVGYFSAVGSFNTPPSTAAFMPVNLTLTGTYYETCLPITEPIGGTSDCTNRWYVEVQYFTDPGFSSRPFAGNPFYEWTSTEFTGAVPAQFDAGGFTNFVINNGGNIYPANMMFEPNSYYRILLHTGYEYNGTTTWTNINNLDLHICHFTVNGDATDGPIQVCYGADIIAQASAMAASFVMDVEEFDPNGNPTGAMLTNIISPVDMINGFDVRTMFGFTYAPGYSYTISLNSGGMQFSTKTIQINPIVSSFTINGVQTSPLLLCNASSVIIDGSASSCTSGIYFLRYAECDASGTPLTPWTGDFVGSNIDLLVFASGRVPLVAGKYYKISWGVGSPMFYSEQIIQFSASPAIANAGADQITCGNNVTLTGTTSTYETVQWSIQSGSGGSFANANTASTTFTPTPGQIYTIRYTMTTACGSTYDDVTIYADAIAYNNPNEAYLTEACHGHRRICIIGRNSYTWDPVNMQYIRQNSAGETVVVMPHPFISTLYEINTTKLPGMGTATHAANLRYPAYGWDNETLKDRSGISLPSDYYYNSNEHVWDQNHLFTVVSSYPTIIVDTPGYIRNIAEYLDFIRTFPTPTPPPYGYTIADPFYTPNSGTPYTPGTGAYNILTNPAIINPGNIDLDASPDYILQQDVYRSACRGWGKGWRLPTKTEVGVSESMTNSQMMPLDEAYNLRVNFITSSASSTSAPNIWAFNRTGQYHPVTNKALYNAHWTAPKPAPSTIYYFYCVFKSNPPCGGYYKKEDQVINEDEELIPTKKEVKKQEIKLSFMPNPTSNYVTFNGAADESYNFELIDMQGKLLRSGKIINAEQINLEEYTSGVYLIRLSSHDGAFLGSTRIVRK